MKKYIITALCIVLLALAGFALSARTVTKTDYAMNTVVTITAKSRSASVAIDEALGEVRRIDSLMSATAPDSDISKINSAPHGTPVEVGREVFDLIAMSKRVSLASDGAFDISVEPVSRLWDITSETPAVPAQEDIDALLGCVDSQAIELDEENQTVTLQKAGMQISLGAVAKGYAADRAAEVLRKNGIKDAIIDLGGNIYVIGKDKKIGIQEPFASRGEYFRVCTVSDTSVVTSGAYERYFESDGRIYHHILNPKTGTPAQSGIKSATVICKNSALADALSTAAYVSGKDGARALMDSFPEAEAVLLGDDGKITEYK